MVPTRTLVASLSYVGSPSGVGVVFLLPVSLPSVGLSSDEGYPVLSRFVIRPRSW